MMDCRPLSTAYGKCHAVVSRVQLLAGPGEILKFPLIHFVNGCASMPRAPSAASGDGFCLWLFKDRSPPSNLRCVVDRWRMDYNRCGSDGSQGDVSPAPFAVIMVLRSPSWTNRAS